MRIAALLLLAAAAVLLTTSKVVLSRNRYTADNAQFTHDNRMLRPAAYRDWVWLSSGFGMSYNPRPAADHPPFDNVFVDPAAYHSFRETGKWPDKTVLVLELRSSESRGSINQAGHFQGALLGLDIHVKDESRFPRKWAFFNFDASAQSAAMIPTSADCYSCHEQHAAVDTTFVQFYPTLLEIARQKGTVTRY